MSCNSQVFASPLVRLSDIANWRSGEDVTGNEMYKVAQFSRYRAPLLMFHTRQDVMSSTTFQVQVSPLSRHAWTEKTQSQNKFSTNHSLNPTHSSSSLSSNP